MVQSLQTVRWLHLSDFHFAPKQRWERRKTLTALLDKAEKLRDEGLAPDFVFLTGDLAHSGKQAEYDQAELFCKALGEKLGLEPRESFFLVPGNHDVDRDAIGPADGHILDALKTQDDIEEILDDPETMNLLGRRLEGFYAFTERLLGPARGWRRDKPWRVEEREVGDLRIAIVQLNSAWASGKEDLKGLLVGEAQAQEALIEAADAHLRIVLVHHPPADLRDFDRAPVESRLAAGDVHFLLRGHLHRTGTTKHEGPDGSLVELAAGATYVDDKWPRGFLVTEVEAGVGQGRVCYFRFSDKGKGFWAKDTLSYENVPDGVWSFALPEALQFGDRTPPAESRSEFTDARRATAKIRYRTAAAAVHGSVRFVGFADHRPRPNVTVPELFVPLRFEQDRPGKKKSVTTTQLLAYLLERERGGRLAQSTNLSSGSLTTFDTDDELENPDDTEMQIRRLMIWEETDERAHRVVILGDPGSGKTTLCRFITAVLAGVTKIDGFGTNAHMLPLFLPFRDYVAEEKALSLVEFLVKQARTQLQLALPKGFLDEVLEAGQAVLLLDGLDEVGSTAQREEMRGRVQAFFLRYPKVAALVTSRLAGYEDAPLPRFGPDACQHLRLAPFDDDDLKQFVSHWYTIQEPLDPQARDYGITDLLAAIETSPPLRELARNPMLATLIALVHRYEARLPGERAALYDICVRTLLDTWPEARRTTFRDIDVGLQRVYLEELAYYMQLARTGTRREVTITRLELVTTLVDIVLRRQGDGVGIEMVRRLIQRWTRFLERGSGLLIEQRPGVFAFFHLSLMEYLAARGIDIAADPIELIAERFRDPRWREVCLLAIGNKAADKSFLDRLFEKIQGELGGWSFLLRCLREEAAFDQKQVARIIREVAHLSLNCPPEKDQKTMAELLRFSLRHSEWISTWLRRSVFSATGDTLRGLVRLNPDRSGEWIELLNARQDAGRVAGDLLDFWPTDDIGRWAAAKVSPRRALRAGLHSSLELLVSRSLFLEDSAAKLGPAFIIGHLSIVSELSIRIRTAVDERVGEKSPNGKEFPAAVRVVSTAQILPVEISVPPTLISTSRRDLTQYFAQNFALDFVPEFEREFPRYFALKFSSRYRANVAQFVERDYASAFALDFVRDFVRHFSQDFKKYFALDFVQYFVRDFALDFDNRFNKELTSPSKASGSPDLNARSDASRTGNREEMIKLAATVPSRLAAEAWIALMTTAHKAEDEQLFYVHRRVQNAWLLQVFPAVDRRFSRATSPDLEAVYYTLGFIQATTTWQWPTTERWRTLLGGDPPSHWLPRSQWHLCWLLYDDNDEAHRQGLDKALDEGLKDEQRPGAAAALRELLPRRT